MRIGERMREIMVVMQQVNAPHGNYLRDIVEAIRGPMPENQRERDNLYAMYSRAMKRLLEYGIIEPVRLRATLRSLGEEEHYRGYAKIPDRLVYLEGYMLQDAKPTRDSIVAAVNNLWWVKEKGLEPYGVGDLETVEKLVEGRPNVRWEAIPL
jgi:hypothetical protein